MNRFTLVMSIICCLSLSFTAEGQNTLDFEESQDIIEGLNIFPNPAANGKLYITTDHNQAKSIEIFDVLGKRIMAASILGNELDISRLSPGIYILKIRENDTIAVRKLIVK